MGIQMLTVSLRDRYSTEMQTSKPRPVVKAIGENKSRRALLSAVSVASLILCSCPSFAAYGDSANVFGKITNKSGFVAYAGEGFSLLLPSKWNPSKEKDFPGIVLRYEDNFDAVNNLIVIKRKIDKSRIEELGSPTEFLNLNSDLLGK